MNNPKILWEKLAKKNSRYYINSDNGKNITEEEFRESGRQDCLKYIIEDYLIIGRFHLKECSLLEIGCGTGRMTEFLAGYFGEVYAVDISNRMINQAFDRLVGYENVNFWETDGEEIPLEDNTVSIAFSYLVFQHMKTKKMVESNFREVYRILKPGGLFKVRVRTDKTDLKHWWAGVSCDEAFPVSIGFKLLKKEQVEDYGLWLWLQK